LSNSSFIFCVIFLIIYIFFCSVLYFTLVCH
jgi:hypothetical protein